VENSDGTVSIANRLALNGKEVVCTATSFAGQALQCSSTHSVVDTTAPSLECSLNNADAVSAAGAQCAGSGGTTLQAAASVLLEACDCSDADRPVVSCSPPSPGLFPVGSTTFTCTATDRSGNVGSCSVTAKVVDTEAPKMGPTTHTTICDDGLFHRITAADCAITAVDTCSGARTPSLTGVSINQASACSAAVSGFSASGVSLLGSGAGRVYRLSWTATDAAGLSSVQVCEVSVGSQSPFGSSAASCP